MTVPADPTPALQEYARPEKLVTTQWLADQLAAGRPENLVVVESDEDVLLYETGHIPGSVKVDWHTELNDPVVRDYVDGMENAYLAADLLVCRAGAGTVAEVSVMWVPAVFVPLAIGNGEQRLN